MNKEELIAAAQGLVKELRGAVNADGMGLDQAEAKILENLVLQDLLAWRAARLDRAEILYWRTAGGEEEIVDTERDTGHCR